MSKNTAKQDSIMEVQVVTYITYKKNKETRRPVCQIERGAIQPGGQVSSYLIPEIILTPVVLMKKDMTAVMVMMNTKTSTMSVTLIKQPAAGHVGER